MKEYYEVRYEYYNKRKKYLIDKLGKELVILSNKARYIKGNLEDKIDLRKKTKEQIDKMLEDMKFDKHVKDNNYNYLIKMPMDSVCKENVEKIMKEHGEKEEELESIKSSSVEKMWLKELCDLKKHM
jgi:DNA topoisomerase-2